MNKDINLRGGFDSNAQLYHKARPRYPDTLFETLIRVTNLQNNANLLEIGPGTGQATEPLARRGYKITAVELGVELAEVAKDALKKYKNVEIVTGAFEDIELPPNSFDLVYAATAFHWIEPAVRFKKPHTLLRNSGHLAIIHTNHVSDEQGDKFFFASQPIYKKYELADLDGSFRIPRTANLKPEELDENLFTPVFFQAFPLTVRYTGDEFAELLSTYSPTIAMSPEMRRGFLKEIAQLIDIKFGGSLIKPFAMTLTIAKKKSQYHP
jgi:SAM-dependent methyltransferase